MQLAASILQDNRGAVRPFADRRDSTIAQGRHSVKIGDSTRGVDQAPARAVPVLDGRTDGIDVRC